MTIETEQDLKMPIDVGSREAACLHEAGHAIVAFLSGAAVSGIRVGRTYPFNAGMFMGLKEGSELVALAGVALEMRLVDAELFTRNNNVVGSHAEMLALWSKTCLGDLQLWAAFRAERLGHDERPTGGWFHRFCSEAAVLSKELNIEAAERVAIALGQQEWLAGERIGDLLTKYMSNKLEEPLRTWVEQGCVNLGQSAS